MELQREIIEKIKALVDKDSLYRQPCGDQKAYDEFLGKFPADGISGISLEDYCIGDNSACPSSEVLVPEGV